MGFGQYYSSQSYALGQQNSCNAFPGVTNTFQQTFQSLQQTARQLSSMTMQMDNFCGPDILGQPQGQLPKPTNPVPYDKKTAYYPNFDNNKNIRAHMGKIILDNPNVVDYLKKNDSTITMLVKDFTNPRQTTKDERHLMVNDLLDAGFTNKDIQRLALLGAIHHDNALLDSLEKKCTDKSLKLKAAGNINIIRESQIKQYHKIDPPMVA